MLKFHALLTAFIVGLSSFLFIQPAFAASKTINGLSVSPAIINIQASPGQDVVTFNETITNITTNQLAVNLSVKDFGALNASGSIGFYGSGYKSFTNPHSLSSAIDLPTTEYLINPHQSQTISVNINNVSQLSAGGHYSALIFTPFIAISGATHNQVNLQPSVASLIFLTTASGGVQGVKLGGLSMASIGFTLPSNVYVLLTNTGNTQIIPRGSVTLKGPTSNLITQSIINSNSGLILPNTSRLFNETLTSSHDLFKLAGIYHLQLIYRVDGSSNFQTATKSFLYINPLIFVFLLLIILIIRFFVGHHKKSKYKTKVKRRFRRAKL